MTRCGCGCWPGASATRASGFGTATNGRRTSREEAHGRGTSRRSWTTRGWSRRRNGCGSWTGSRRSRACGSATRTRSFLSTLARGLARTGRRRRSIWAIPAFHRLFLAPRQLRPRVVVKGSGIDWLAVSAEWEQEGMKLTAADLQRLQTATGRFIKLPDSGWVELDSDAVQSAHEAMADLGVDGLVPVAQRIGIEQAAHLDEEGLKRFGDSPQAQALRERLKNFKGIAGTPLPAIGAGGNAALSEGRLRFPLPSDADPAGRHPGGRHGPGQDAANARLAGVAQGPATRRTRSRRW